MDAILQQLEDSLGVPAGLLQRAAAARASVIGTSAESVVQAWGGEGELETAPEAPAAAAAPAVTEAPAAEETPPAEPEPAAAEAPATEEAEPAATAEEAGEDDEPVPGPRAVSGAMAGFPSWLAAALVLIPMVALAYALIAPNGPGCGTSGQLAIDEELGIAENCDGTEYGAEATGFYAVGEGIYDEACAACHGPTGGGGTGPAMSGEAVLATFPAGSCAEHISWVALGTAAWPEPTYGANETALKASGAEMPGFGESLSPEDLASVVIFERVQFGGQSLADAEAECAVEDLELAGE